MVRPLGCPSGWASLFGHDKIFLLPAQSLFNKQNTHTHTRQRAHYTIMWCVWGQMIVLGMVQWPTLNSHWAATATVAEMTPRHHYQTKQLALRTGTVFLSLFLLFLFRFSPFFLLLLFLFYFWLTRKMKMFNGKNKILTFLSQANVIQFVLLVRKLK